MQEAPPQALTVTFRYDYLSHEYKVVPLPMLSWLISLSNYFPMVRKMGGVRGRLILRKVRYFRSRIELYDFDESSRHFIGIGDATWRVRHFRECRFLCMRHWGMREVGPPDDFDVISLSSLFRQFSDFADVGTGDGGHAPPRLNSILQYESMIAMQRLPHSFIATLFLKVCVMIDIMRFFACRNELVPHTTAAGRRLFRVFTASYFRRSTRVILVTLRAYRILSSKVDISFTMDYCGLILSRSFDASHERQVRPGAARHGISLEISCKTLPYRISLLYEIEPVRY